MELRRAGEVLLRSHPTALLSPSSISSRACRKTPFLPSIPWTHRGAVSAINSHRSFSTALQRNQQAAARAPDPPRSTQQQSSNNTQRMLDEALDFSSTTPTSQHRTSRLKSPHAQQAQRQQTHPGSRHNVTPHGAPSPSPTPRGPTSSLDDALAAMTASVSSPRYPPNPSTRDPRISSSTSFDVSQLNDPLTFTNLTPPPPLNMPRIPPPSSFRLGPSLGRTVNVEPAKGVDLARGLRQLEILCARNKVRVDEARQRFHERGGLKRKRLRRERWRRRFKEGFQAVVGRVQELRRKGW